MKTGDKVVCIKEPINPALHFESYPKKGEIYTVRAVDRGYVRLIEIVNPIMQYYDGYGECQFGIHLFRPVDDTFGEVVAEIIEKQVEVEQMETV